MSALGERDENDDLFDFSEQILGGSSAKEPVQQENVTLNLNSEVHTSFILVNALLNLLVRKGIIYPHEVNALVAELHVQYMKQKRGDIE